MHCFHLATSDNILPERDEHKKDLAGVNDEMKENKEGPVIQGCVRWE